MSLAEAFSACLKVISWALNLFGRIMYQANATGVYVAFFFIYTVMRLFIRPLVGEAHREVHNELRKNARSTIKKHTNFEQGGN